MQPRKLHSARHLVVRGEWVTGLAMPGWLPGPRDHTMRHPMQWYGVFLKISWENIPNSHFMERRVNQKCNNLGSSRSCLRLLSTLPSPTGTKRLSHEAPGTSNSSLQRHLRAAAACAPSGRAGLTGSAPASGYSHISSCYLSICQSELPVLSPLSWSHGLASLRWFVECTK